jgi:hypothetical protein
MNQFERTIQYGNYYEGGGKTSAAMAGGTQRAQNNPASNPSGVASTTDTSKAADAVKGNSLVWWLIIAVIFAVLAFVVERFDTASTFGNVKLSFYNMVIIGLNAVLFIALAKAAAFKLQIPGLSAVFLAV